MPPLATSARERKRKDAYDKLSKKHVEFEEFILSARKRMRLMCDRQSSKSVTTENHTVFFDFFMQTPVGIGENLHLYPVDPIHWASAFMKSNIGDSAFVLFRAILTQEDLIVDPDASVPMNIEIHEKIVAVKKAAKWMTNKNRDPWSWPYTCKETEALSTEDDRFVDIAFSNVKSANIYPPFPLEGSLDELLDNMRKDRWISKEKVPDFDHLAELDELNFNEKNLEQLCDLAQSKDDDPTFFQRVVSMGILGNAAQVSRELTKITIPTNTEVFVDAVQFSAKRCIDAAKQDGKVSMAEMLFRKYWGTNCTTTSFKSLEDICSVTRLAILRAIEWSSINNNTISILEFDSAISGHNVFPSEKEVEAIEKMFKTYVGMLRSPNGERKKDPKFVDYIDVELETDYEELNTNNSKIPSPNPGKSLAGWCAANFPAETLQDTLSTTCSSLCLGISAPLENNNIIMEPAATVQIAFANGQFQCPSSVALSPEIPTINIQDLRNDEIQNESTVEMKIISSEEDIQTETGSSNGQYPFTPIIHQFQPIRMIETLNNCSCEHVQEIICLRLDSHSQEGIVTIGDSGFGMQRVIWDEAFRKLKDKGESQAKVGLFLFGKLFTHAELQKKPEKEKNKKSVLSVTKKQGILESLAIMKAMIRKRNGLKLSGLDAGVKLGIIVHKRSVEEVGVLEIKIFVEGRNYFAKKNFKSTVEMEIISSEEDIQTETGSSNGQYPFTPIIHQFQPIRMIETLNNCSCEHVQEVLCLRLDSHSQEGIVTIGDSGFGMQRVIWDEAFRKLKDKGESQAKVGLFLFGKLFTHAELQKKPEKEKNKKSVLSVTKTQGILESLAIMKAMIRNGLKLSGLDAGVKLEIIVHKRSVEEVGFLEIKIFVEGRNYFAKKN